MNAKTILVDSNVLVYAINNASPKHRAAQGFLQENIGNMAIAHQNIFESLRVLTHPKFQNPMTSAAAIAAINAISNHCRIFAPDYETHEIALALIKKHGLAGNKIFDAYLTATALSTGITSIATDNTQDFMPFKEVSLINPFK
jgi:toxin-antitoxin system PIN domain toxin